jgi:hypothetical protein
MELYAMVEELEETGQEIDFPAWWQAMITDSKEQMVKSKHYLDFELKEPAIDAAVDALTGEAPHMGEPEAPMMEAEIGKDEILAGKIMKALKEMANKDASDQNNLKQARTALNKGNMSAAEKIAKPYLSEKIAKQLKEYTYDDFSGSKLIANTPIPTDIDIFKKFFPTGVASISNAKASLQASDNTGIKIEWDDMLQCLLMFNTMNLKTKQEKNTEHIKPNIIIQTLISKTLILTLV